MAPRRTRGCWGSWLRSEDRSGSLLFVNKKKQKNFARLGWVVVGVILCGYGAGGALADGPGDAVVSTTDLTEAFHTKEKMNFVVFQEPSNDEYKGFEQPGLLHVCFVRSDKTDCPLINVQSAPPFDEVPTPFGATINGSEEESEFNTFENASVLPANKFLRASLLALNIASFNGGPGMPFATVVFAYRPSKDNFDPIFSQWTSRNVNEEIRVIPDGPLSGDVIVVSECASRTCHYGITVYRLTKTIHYAKVLRFKGNAKFDDGDPRPVIDADMPEILHRMHFPGQ